MLAMVGLIRLAAISTIQSPMKNWFPNRLYRIAPGKAPELLHLVSDTWEGEPAFTPDHQLVITAIKNPGSNTPWQADLYRFQRDGGNWVNPTRLPDVINSPASEWNASFANNGNSYFSSERKKVPVLCMVIYMLQSHVRMDNG